MAVLTGQEMKEQSVPFTVAPESTEQLGTRLTEELKAPANGRALK